MQTRKRARTGGDDEDALTDGLEPSASQRLEVGPSQAEDAVPAEQRLRDAEFWFEDGSVVLVAGGIAFKVYRGVLSDRSPVFKDMFSLPQPPSSSPFDTPVVHLTDLPQDLRHILRACMPRGWIGVGPSSETPSFYATSAYIRLGHKYQMSDLLDISLKHLQNFYTSSVDRYNLVRRHDPDYWGASAMHVVALARLLGENFLLPVALLECCMLNEKLLDGFAREDGTVEYFTQDDLKLCFKARATLVTKNTHTYLEVFKATPSSGCKTMTECGRALTKCLENGGAHIGVATSTDLGALLSPIKHQLCQTCHGMVRRRAEVAQEKFWKRLPGLLGITVNAWPLSV